MNISKINSAGAAKIYAEANKKINRDGAGNGQARDVVFEKGGVNISREAKGLHVLDFAKERIKADLNSGGVSADRLGALKLAVQSGEYRVSAAAIAAAIIEGAPRA